MEGRLYRSRSRSARASVRQGLAGKVSVLLEADRMPMVYEVPRVNGSWRNVKVSSFDSIVEKSRDRSIQILGRLFFAEQRRGAGLDQRRMRLG